MDTISEPIRRLQRCDTPEIRTLCFVGGLLTPAALIGSVGPGVFKFRDHWVWLFPNLTVERFAKLLGEHEGWDVALGVAFENGTTKLVLQFGSGERPWSLLGHPDSIVTDLHDVPMQIAFEPADYGEPPLLDLARDIQHYQARVDQSPDPKTIYINTGRLWLAVRQLNERFLSKEAKIP